MTGPQVFVRYISHSGVIIVQKGELGHFCSPSGFRGAWNFKVFSQCGSMELSLMMKIFYLFAVQNGSHEVNVAIEYLIHG